MSNPISLIGTVATDPKRIVTQSGVTLCSFRLASGERRFDREHNAWVDGETNWFGVTAFRGLGEHAAESLRKGERVIVSGRLRIRRWENEEKSGTSVEIEADALGHDLRWGVSQFEKRTQSSDGPPTEVGDAQSSDADPGAAAAHEAAFTPSEDSAHTRSGDGFLPVAV